MRAAPPRVTTGGKPTAAEAAALGAALAALLEAEPAAAPAGPPPAYASPWRRAGLLDAVRALPRAAELARGWRA